MNRKELIERIKNLPFSYIHNEPYLNKEAVLEFVKHLDEPKKPVVPQFVADWYEENKDDFDYQVWRCVFYDGRGEETEISKWICITEDAFLTLVNMHQFGYEVEEEKRYIIKVKATKCSTKNLVFGELSGSWFFAEGKYGNVIVKHTRKELEESGFGWVFDCPGIEIEEVE